MGNKMTILIIGFGEVSFQFSSVAQSCPTLCDPMNCSTPGLPVHHQHPELTQTHVHEVSDAISVVPFSSCLQSFPAAGSFLMSQLFSSGGQSIGASASTPVLSMNSQGWFALGWTGLISSLSKGLLRIFSSTAIWRHQLFRAQPSLGSKNLHMTTGKTIALMIQTLLSLLFNTLSTFLIAFLPRSKYLLTSWLVTICGEFGV